ncbi:MAG: type 4a pilus biogenesis protein PilO, partial [Blastocatellia bacterium]
MAASVQTIAKPAEETGSILNRIPWYLQMLILLGLVLVLSVVAHMLLFSDTNADTAKLKEQTQTLKTKNAQGNIIRQNLLATQETLKEKQAEMEKLRDLLPDQVEISRVYDNIKDFMREDHLMMKNFDENKEENHDYYTAVPIKVQVSGTYDSLGQFFSRLGFYTRIVSVSEVEVKQAVAADQELGRSIDGSFTI